MALTRYDEFTEAEKRRAEQDESFGIGMNNAKEAYAKSQAAGDIEGMKRAEGQANALRGMGGGMGEYSTNGSFGGGSSGGNRLTQGYDSAAAAYQAAQKAEQEKIRAGVEKSVSQLQQRIPTVQKTAANQTAGAYNTYLKSVNPFGATSQANAALNLNNTGVTETNRANTANAYQGAVNQYELAKQTELTAIENAKREAYLNGDIAKAEALARSGQQMAQLEMERGTAEYNAALRAEEVALNNARYADETAYNRGKYESETEYQRNQANAAWERQMAQIAMESGYFGNLEALGFSKAAVAAMEAQYKASQMPTVIKAAYKGSSSKKKIKGDDDDDNKIPTSESGVNTVNTELQKAAETATDGPYGFTEMEAILERAFQNEIITEKEMLALAKKWGIKIV